MRRLGHILSIALITAGLLVIADVGITLAYQEPLSSIYSSIKQGEKESQLKTLEAEFLTQSDVQAIEQAKQTKDPKARKQVESANVAQLGRTAGRRIEARRRARPDRSARRWTA